MNKLAALGVILVAVVGGYLVSGWMIVPLRAAFEGRSGPGIALMISALRLVGWGLIALYGISIARRLAK